MTTRTCCLCKKPIDIQRWTTKDGRKAQWTEGHNASPAKEGRCCTECNNFIVLPLRLRRVFAHEFTRQEAPRLTPLGWPF